MPNDEQELRVINVMRVVSFLVHDLEKRTGRVLSFDERGKLLKEWCELVHNNSWAEDPCDFTYDAVRGESRQPRMPQRSNAAHLTTAFGRWAGTRPTSRPAGVSCNSPECGESSCNCSHASCPCHPAFEQSAPEPWVPRVTDALATLVEDQLTNDALWELMGDDVSAVTAGVELTRLVKLIAVGIREVAQ